MTVPNQTWTNFRGQRIEWTRFGNVRVDGKRVPRSQRFFWTKEWQEGEREAEEQIANGDVETYRSARDFFDRLEGLL